MYRRLIEDAPDSIIIADLDATIRSVNLLAARTLPPCAAGASLLDALTPSQQSVLRDAIDRAIRSGQPADYEFAIHGPGGVIAWYLGRVGLIHESARRRRLMIIARDITEDKRAQQDLDRLFAMSLDMLCVADTEGYFTRVNPAFERTLGYAAADLTAKPFISFVHKDDRAATAAELAKISAGLDTLHFENRYRAKDGSYRWFAWTARAPGPGENLIYAVARDVTEQKRAAELTRRHEDEIAHLARRITLGEMATGLAHELNQPLAAIGNYAAGCRRRIHAAPGGGPEMVEALDRIVSETKRAGGIIRSLRRLMVKRETHRTMVDINQLVRDMQQLIASEAAQLRVEIVAGLAAELPPVSGDAVQIEQVILNLLRNAVEAVAGSAIRKRRITVTTRLANDRAIELTVQDSGPGLSAQVAERLFEPFFTTKPDGLGMGLKISRSIVESHGGRISAAGDAGEGATFVVRLPISDGEARRSSKARTSSKQRRA